MEKLSIRLRQFKAPFLALLSIFSFSLMALCVKTLLEASFSFQEIVFFRSSVIVLISGLMIKVKNLSFWGSKESQKTLFLRSLFGYLALLGFFVSLEALPLAASSMVKYLSPIFSGVIAFFLLKESISSEQIFCLILGLLGITVASGAFEIISFSKQEPDFAYWPWLVCLLSTFLTGFAYTFVRKASISGTKEQPETIVFYFAFFCLFPSLLFALFDFQLPDLRQALLLSAIGVFAYLGQSFLVRALAIEKTAIVTKMSYCGFIFSACWDFLFFDRVLSLNLLFGTLLIIGSQFLFLEKKKL